MHICTQTKIACIRNTYLVFSVTAVSLFWMTISFSYLKELMFNCIVPTATCDYASHNLFWVSCCSSLPLPISFSSLSNTIFSYLFTVWLPKFLDCSLSCSTTPIPNISDNLAHVSPQISVAGV